MGPVKPGESPCEEPRAQVTERPSHRAPSRGQGTGLGDPSTDGLDNDGCYFPSLTVHLGEIPAQGVLVVVGKEAERLERAKIGNSGGGGFQLSKKGDSGRSGERSPSPGLTPARPLQVTCSPGRSTPWAPPSPHLPLPASLVSSVPPQAFALTVPPTTMLFLDGLLCILRECAALTSSLTQTPAHLSISLHHITLEHLSGSEIKFHNVFINVSSCFPPPPLDCQPAAGRRLVPLFTLCPQDLACAS